ncbi:MAG TPA: YceI family protein [Thermoanaerobaculia bacterium]|nr:YceI family protein [Thermoanaerobaculia bacterium]
MNSLMCFAATAAMLCATNGVATTTRLTVAPRSTLLLQGSSNLAKWRCSGSTLNGSMYVAAPIEKINAVIDRIEEGDVGAWMSEPAAATFPQPRFELTIPIEALRCTGGRPMERDLVAALKAAHYPDITFRFVRLKGGVEHDIDRHLYRVVILGEISLAGTTRDVEIVATAERLASDRFRIQAALPLRMTDFGVNPPRALLGLLRAADDLTVEMDLFLQVDSHA